MEKQRRGFAKSRKIKKNLAAPKIRGDFPAFSADFPTITLCTLIISMIKIPLESMYLRGIEYGPAGANRADTLLPRIGVAQVHFKVQ